MYKKKRNPIDCLTISAKRLILSVMEKGRSLSKIEVLLELMDSYGSSIGVALKQEDC